ncbi:endonuclease/exonuclease/phosphatase family protein [Lentibacillus jeotgali]|uniref:endonuclease/exonuclease/phosphatase family protein n=1 Tax=Lentibacillus jeotgali TaxID=558169 RepID=UPI0002628C29|nr:endonuclease/exonuclease/phosphatase family protein [Lentibacillus jeotgali]
MAILTIPLTQAHADDKNARNVTIKVMTYNIHAGIGSDGNYDIDRIADVIEASDADVIGLQEVDKNWGYRSNFEDGLQKLAEKLDMHAFMAPIYNQDPINEGDPRRKYGVAVLSKYPIIDSANRAITRLSTQDANPEPTPAPGFAETVINAKGAMFSFYVTHLDYRGDPYVREMQVNDMLDIIPADSNAILTGDMNAGPDAPELSPLFSRFNDAWAESGEGEGYTYLASSPSKRIDYILTSQGLGVSNAKVIDTLASDHLPVVTDVTLKRGNGR